MAQTTSISNENGEKFELLEAQLDEIKGIMVENIQGVIERAGKLDELNERAENLAKSANAFEKCACGLRTKYWWKQRKLQIIFAMFLIVIIIIFILSIFEPWK